LLLVIAIVGVLATLATFGVGRYVAAAKSVEATTNVGAIGKAVSAAAMRVVPTPGVTNPDRRQGRYRPERREPRQPRSRR
jgi:type IV pilus assembly protein PilA